MHNTCTMHGRDIKTQNIGSTSILLIRKDGSSIRLDRTQLIFRKNFQFIVFQKLLGWKLEKSCSKICSSPSSWMDGVFRAVRWVMRGFDAADSERTVRPESPTSSRQHLSIFMPTKTMGRVGRAKKIPHTPERGVNHGQAASG